MFRELKLYSDLLTDIVRKNLKSAVQVQAEAVEAVRLELRKLGRPGSKLK